MGEQKPEGMKKHICTGLLAHVDAGKTTLSEAILYTTGTIRKLGRVDNKDAFLDTYQLERARGITIFSKQAELTLGDTAVTLLDTPGHVDFSAEMERTLQVLDYAVLVINGADGVQGHTETLWRLLKRYRIPVFLFVNKMDQPGTDREALLSGLKRRLDSAVTDFTGVTAGTDGILSYSGDRENGEEFFEEISMAGEELLEEYLERGILSVDPVRRAVKERRLFPCYFGSALKLTGVEEFLKGFETFTAGTGYSREFGARVFKISRDSQGNRLTHLKITGGSLKVKSFLDQEQTEKVNQIRIYSGEKFELASEAEAGCICVVTGPSDTRPGQGFGVERSGKSPLLEPVLTYQVILPDGADAHVMLKNLRLLEEEDPLLHIVWDETLGEIRAQVMGQVQMEILKSQILERFGVEVDFGTGNIVYKETIQRPVEGVGHFEPLRHYAEVHLLMEPLEPGSGLVLGCDCSEDLLDRNWQRLVLTHLEEKKYRGTLTGSEITDMRITLTAGRAHIKHTEGGDFRQATYRAVRQGLKEAGCRLLEPYYAFILEVPEESVGRAMADIDRMHGKFQAPETRNGMAVMTGSAPAACMRDYQREVTNCTRGRGRLSLSLKGYEPCHNQDEVVEAMGYDFDGDLADPAGSVFCSHGAGVVVPWDQVKKHMHVQTPLDKRRAAGVDLPDRKEREDESSGAGVPEGRSGAGAGGGRSSAAGTGGGAGRLSASYYEDKELEEIFKRTYGEPKRSYPPGNALGQRTAEARSTGGLGHGTGSGQSTDGPGQKTAGGRRAGSSRPGPWGPDRADRKRGRGTGAADTSSGTEEEYLLVDGYNIIFAWEELSELAKVNIDGARYRLMDILCNYQGYKKCTLIVVFDAYKVEGNTGEAIKYHNIHVVYTKEAETADQYIEKLAHKIGPRYRVTVATSDGLEQLIIRGQGCLLLSARDLKEEVDYVESQIADEQGRLKSQQRNGKNYLLSHADGELREYLETVRLGNAGTSGRIDKEKP